MIIDLTTLEKCGKFQEFEHLISVYNGKRGLHLVVLYLVVGRWRVPWSLRVWRGKQAPSPAQLGFKLLKNLPKALTDHFQVMILADTAFGQGTLLGVYRWLVLSLIAYLLAHWAYLSTQLPDLPDWGEAAQIAREFIFPQILVSLLLLNIEHLIPLARSYGFYIHVSRCKI